MADTFTFNPDFGCKAQYKPAIHVSKFNDGYEQRLEYGINTNPENWPLTFSLRSDTETASIKTFLKTQGGVQAFNWTTPLGDAFMFVCRSWDITKVKFNLNTITCTFEQVFES